MAAFTPSAVAVRSSGLYAAHFAVFHDQLLGARVGEHLGAGICHGLAQRLGSPCAAALIGQLAVVGVFGQVVQAALHVVLNARVLVDPVGGLAHVLGIELDELRHADALAVLLEVLDHGFGGVVGHAGLRLQLAALHHLVAAGHGDGPAQAVGLLHQDDGMPQLLQADGGGHARAAGADDHGVGAHFHGLAGLRLARGRLHGGEAAACLLDGVGYGGDDAHAGEGGAGDGVHVNALSGHDGGRQLFQHAIGNSGGFGLLNNLDRFDGVLAEGHFNNNVASVAGTYSLVGAGGECGLCGGAGAGGTAARDAKPGGHGQQGCQCKGGEAPLRTTER